MILIKGEVIMVDNKNKIWKKFLSKHWREFTLFIILGVIGFVAAIYVFLWFVGEAQSTGLVPSVLGLWSMGHFITFLVRLILWEALFIGIPGFIALVAIYYLWWKKLPSKERKEYKEGNLFSSSSKSRDAGGGISFLIFVFFAIKIYMDGKWGVPFATWKFEYLVYSYLTAFMWIAIVFGIPILIGGIWWMRKQTK